MLVLFLYIFYFIAAYILFKCAKTISHLNPFHMWSVSITHMKISHVKSFPMWNFYMEWSVSIPQCEIVCEISAKVRP